MSFTLLLRVVFTFYSHLVNSFLPRRIGLFARCSFNTSMILSCTQSELLQSNLWKPGEPTCLCTTEGMVEWRPPPSPPQQSTAEAKGWRQNTCVGFGATCTSLAQRSDTSCLENNEEQEESCYTLPILPAQAVAMLSFKRRRIKSWKLLDGE